MAGRFILYPVFKEIRTRNFFAGMVLPRIFSPRELAGCRTFYFRTMQSGPFSLTAQQGSGTMRIMLHKGLTLQQGTFTAIIAPEPVILSALNDNLDLGRFLFLFVCGNYSSILARINRTSSNFEIRRPFTADQLLTALKEASHTVIFIEHDSTFFDGAERLLTPVSAALRDAGREALVILYSPVMDQSFAVLARHADRVIEIVHPDEAGYGAQYQSRRTIRQGRTSAPAQKTLGGF
jgi:DNA polymerase I